MKSFLITLLTLYSLSLYTQATIDWSNPSLACPENLFPKGIPCLDLSSVGNVYTDFPSNMAEDEISTWQKKYSKDLKLCRNLEVLKRETEKPGSYKPIQIQLAWMNVNGAKEKDKKLSGIYQAAKNDGVPPHVLLGALNQESLLSNLGLTPDGGNYSCGIAQLNILEWCQSANSLSKEEKAILGWPAIECRNDMISPAMLEPFYNLAIKELGEQPDYLLTYEHFKDIKLENVVADLPSATLEIQKKRFQAITSFLKYCQDNTDLSIRFKGKTLRGLFDKFIPETMKKNEMYTEGKTFNQSCEQNYPSNYYPLHTGWLLAVAIYNAGPNQPKLVEHYYHNKIPSNLNPHGLIEALHWGGKYKIGTTRVYFGENSQTWFKSCIVQRHVARVIQHTTLPGVVVAKSLEEAPCVKDEVPLYRQKSSGVAP